MSKEYADLDGCLKKVHAVDQDFSLKFNAELRRLRLEEKQKENAHLTVLHDLNMLGFEKDGAFFSLPSSFGEYEIHFFEEDTKEKPKDDKDDLLGLMRQALENIVSKKTDQEILSYDLTVEQKKFLGLNF